MLRGSTGLDNINNVAIDNNLLDCTTVLNRAQCNQIVVIVHAQQYTQYIITCTLCPHMVQHS